MRKSLLAAGRGTFGIFALVTCPRFLCVESHVSQSGSLTSMDSSSSNKTADASDAMPVLINPCLISLAAVESSSLRHSEGTIGFVYETC